jgi:hypothetical protein
VDFTEVLKNKEEEHREMLRDDMERNLEKDELDTVRSIEQEIVEKVSGTTFSLLYLYNRYNFRMGKNAFIPAHSINKSPS